MATTYQGWRSERIGVLGKLSVGQVTTCLVATIPAFAAFSLQKYALGAGCLALAAVLAALIIVPMRERTAYRWVLDSSLHLAGKWTGASRWRAQAATGYLSRDQVKAFDLPGPLQGLKVHDGPPMPAAAMRRVCLVQDPRHGGRWTVTAAMHHPGLSLSDPSARDRYASSLGRLLADQARAGQGIFRISLYVRTVPDDGAERAAWHAENARDDVPPELIEATDQLEQLVMATSVTHEIYVAVVFRDDQIRKAAKASGGGVGGRAAVIYRQLADIDRGLHTVGCTDVTWLGTEELASVVRTGYNPGEAVAMGLAKARAARGMPSFGGVEPAAAGPSQAPPPAPRSYSHDAYRTVSYALVLPELGTQVGRLAQMLAPAQPLERRALALHYEPMDPARAEKTAARDSSLADMAEELKRSKGFRIDARHRRLRRETQSQEELLAAGHTMVRVAGAASVTAPAGNEIEQHAALLESAARAGGYSLMRLDLAQPAGFIASVLPLGLGLPERSGV